MSLWGISSAGRAPALHAGGQGFEPLILHQRASGSASGRGKLQSTLKTEQQKRTQAREIRRYEKDGKSEGIYDFSSQIHKIRDFGIWVHEAFDQIEDLE